MNVESFKELYDSFGVWAPVIIVSITLIRILLNPQKLREFMDTFSYARRRSIRDKEKSLESPYLDSLTRESIQKQIAEDYFYQSTGMRLDFYLRHAILQLYEYSKGSITLSNFKRSKIHLSYEDNRLKVSINKFEKLFGIFSGIFFLVLSAIATFLTLYLISFLLMTDSTNILSKDDIGSAIVIIIYIIVMLWGSFLFLNIFSEMKNSEKIEKYLNENPDFNDVYLTKESVFDISADRTQAIENQDES
ncbi:MULTISPECIES: hypothetical protein [unclassified Psychrobacter]|uniref:hypothetical protein n=1 Tax=unclassified Psychrobacter TaxID=196806 RepID=UPI00384D2DB8